MGRAFEVRKASMAKTGAMKAKLYSMFSKEIYLAAKGGTPDPDMNASLKRTIDKAKKQNVPADIIKRAIDKAKSGSDDNYMTLKYEGFGPGNSTIIVECLTDNINRALSEVRPAFTKSKSKIGAEGSVSYQYDHLSIVSFKNDLGLDEEQTLDALMEAEVEIQDIENEDGLITIYADPTDLFNVKHAIENKVSDIEFEVDEITYLPHDYCTLEGEDLEMFNRLLTMLNDSEEVNNIYHNVTLEA